MPFGYVFDLAGIVELDQVDGLLYILEFLFVCGFGLLVLPAKVLDPFGLF